MFTPSVSVVVPALNEARNIPHVFAWIPADVYEVIPIDGLSVDDIVAIARQVRPDVQVVVQTRQGKGNASFEHPRIHGVSNLGAFRDGLRVLQTILDEWYPTPRQILASQPICESISSSLAGSEQWPA